jgi:hypothetical protein
MPNAMVEILQEPRGASTPANVLAGMEEVTLRMGGGLMDNDWKIIIEWCLVASQSDDNRKSLLSIDVDSVAINDDKFNTWVESKLNMAGKTPLKELANTGVASPSATPSERAAPHGAPLGFNRRAGGYVTMHPRQ